ncbi:hypothetical protein niasHS_000574 [Heterodera schachtii]|uniref:TFIIS N-terminal domain-containing protein n=1 Tax=Heterodera schachtii TaxID=97005 RepID=A0ABD2K5E2_HETSC
MLSVSIIILLHSTDSSAVVEEERAPPPAALRQPSSWIFKQWKVESTAQTTTLSSSDVGGGNRNSNSEHSSADNTKRAKKAAKVVVNKRREVKEFVLIGGGGDVKEAEVAAGTVTLPEGAAGVGRVDDPRRENSNRMVAACVATPSATVTATAATFFNHNQTGFAGTLGGGGGSKKGMEANSNPPKASKGVTMTTAEVDQLRQQLQSVVENGDLTASNVCVEQLESAVLSKDTLEATRIGRFVNDVRKQTAQQWSDFSKRCRALIKQWQKVAEYRPSSSCEGSSNGGTPQLVSPALKRGLTPRAGAVTTPGKRTTPHQQQQQQKRVTSTGLCPPDSRQHTGRSSSTLASSVSPVENGVPTASGSYAPLPSTVLKKESPRQITATVQQQHSMHKSASVGASLSCLGGSSAAKRTVPMLNGIAEDGGAVSGGAHLASSSSYADVTKDLGAVQPSLTAPSAPLASNPPLTLKLKRSASGVQRLTSSLSPPSDNGIGAASTSSSAPLVAQQPLQQLSVLAARQQNVQSTAQLAAQLSMALPQNIGIDLSNRTQQQQQQTVGSAAQKVVVMKISSEPIPTSADGVKRRHQKRKGGRASEERTDATLVKQMKETDTGETGTMKEEEGKQHKREGKTEVKEEDKLKTAPAEAEKKTGKDGKRGRKKKRDKQQREEGDGTKFNWFAEFPFDTAATSISEEQSAPAATDGGIPAKVFASPTRSFVLPAHERHLLLLPYMDIGLPDWRVHDFPQPDRFLFPEPSEWHKKPS